VSLTLPAFETVSKVGDNKDDCIDFAALSQLVTCQSVS